MTKKPTIESVVAAARAKFGTVLSVTLTESVDYADFYLVACKRDRQPTGPERAYMTITARADASDEAVDMVLGAPETRIAFHSGHYDLTIEQLRKAVQDVRSVAA